MTALAPALCPVAGCGSLLGISDLPGVDGSPGAGADSGGLTEGSSGFGSSTSSGGASSSGGSSSGNGSSGSSSGSVSSSGGSSGSSSGSASSSNGSSSSTGGGSSSGGFDVVVDAGPCDGGPLYTHQVGVDGLTWQDCVPTGTYNSTQAVAACEAYSGSIDAGVESCQLPPGTCEYSSEFYPPHATTSTIYFWTYSGQTEATGTGHVVNVSMGETQGGSGCPSAADPTWD